MDKEIFEMVEKIRDAYISVMGADKWQSLTDQEKHDAVMMITSGTLKALTAADEQSYCDSLAAAVAINDADAIREAEGLIVEAAMLRAGYVFNPTLAKYEKTGDING